MTVILLCFIALFAKNSIAQQGSAILTTETSQIEEEQKCVFNLTQPSGIFTSENFPQNYDSDTNCSWNIMGQIGSRIKLTFHILHTEQHDNCIYDWIQVLDSNGTLIKKVCGDLMQDLVLHSTNDSMKVELKSDRIVHASGFLASWETVENDMEIEEINKEKYVLSFPKRFSVGQDSAPAQVCLQTMNLEESGEVTVSVFDKDGLIEDSPKVEMKLIVTKGDETFNCHDLKLSEDFQEAENAVVKVHGDIQGYKILSYKMVRVVHSKPLGLIQTDKYDYRPNQDVHVRMMFMNQELKPASIDYVQEAWIEGPSGSRYHQEKNLPLKHGLAQFQYKLSEEPEQGLWKIQAKFGVNGSQELTTDFEVNEAVLPSFEVTLEAPRIILKDSQGETFRVCAKYTHGANVKGQANVTVSTTFYIADFWRAPQTKINFSRILDIDGCIDATFNSTEVTKLLTKSSPWDVQVTVKESATGEKQSVEKSRIQIESKPFVITSATSPDSYIMSAFPYVGKFKIQDHEKKPLAGMSINVCARLYKSLTELKDFFQDKYYQIYQFNEEQIFELGQKLISIKHEQVCQQQTSDQNGLINVAVNFAKMKIPSDVTKLSLKLEPVEFKEENGMTKPELIHDISITRTNSTSGLILQHETSRLSCGANEIKLYISGKPNEQIEFSHFVASSGAMVDFGSSKVDIGAENHLQDYIGENAMKLEFLGDEESVESEEMPILKMHSFNLSIPNSSSALDKVKLLAYIRDPESLETLSASEDFNVQPCEESKTTMTFSKAMTRPGQEISLTLKGQESGYCGYSIVDKSVALTENPNSVTVDKIAELKDAIDSMNVDFPTTRYYYQPPRHEDDCQEASNLYKAFEKLGLSIMSDMKLSSDDCDTLVDVTDNINNETLIKEQFFNNRLGGPVPVALASVAVNEDFDVRDGSPVAFAASPGAPELGIEPIEEPILDLRSFFPETWLFDLVDLDKNGQYVSQMSAPHTITTWVGDAFCTSSQSGLSIAEQATFKVDQDFFIDMKVPYAIKRDEIMSLNVTAFNKLGQRKLPLKIELLASNEYKLGDFSDTSICLDPEDSQTSVFALKMIELEEVNITVRATIESFGKCIVDQGEGYQDTLQKPVQVRPEGFPMEKVTSEFICRKADEPESLLDLGEMSFDEQDLVEGSTRAWITVSGDVLAPSMNNLDKLVKMPYGCGEQNMISMVPNIYVVSYLEATGQNKLDLISKAKKHMISGYKRQEENYRHGDGSYSVWGPRDEESEGSMWLTSFVVKSFAQASAYIDIDEGKLVQSQRWLNKRQDRDTGCYKAEGFTHYAAYKSETSLTASLLISMSESIMVSPSEALERMNSEPIDQSLKCLDNNINEETDIYTKALAAYAYALQEQIEKAQQFMEQMMAVAQTDEPGKTYWRTDSKSYITSKDVETAAYNVLTLVKLGKLPEALKVIKWLATQRNGYGGFKSTQDTMVALQALSKYSQEISKEENDLEFNVSTTEGEEFAFNVNEGNELLLQMEKLKLDESKTNGIQATVQGQGCFLAQSILRYNVKESPEKTSFELKVQQVTDTVEFCSSYNGNKDKTNMVVIEIELLSGFEPSKEALQSLKDHKLVKKVEYDGKTNIIALYFNEMPKEESCLAFKVKQVSTVEERKPGIAKIYDYYDQRDILSINYTV